MRIALVATAMCLSIVGISVAGPAGASIRRETNIPAQPLAHALQVFAKQRGLVLAYRSEVVGDRQSSGAVGEFTTDEALTQILTGTGLTYRYLDDKTVTIVVVSTPPPATTRSQVEGQGGAAVSDKDGKPGLWDQFLVAQANVGQNSQSASVVSGDSANAQENLRQSGVLQEIVVTARRRNEHLQDVPDSIVALTSSTIQNAGIQTVGDFMSFVPNLTFMDGSSYRPGYITISMRGISNGQFGWPAVTYIVDGVPDSSLDEINTGSLVDVERIEVLRGPQSALYGANAIAGAINVITRAPSNQLEGRVGGAYGNGRDASAEGTLSGPLVEDKLLFRVSASYRNSDGLIDSASNGESLDWGRQLQLKGRLILTPIEDLQFDLRMALARETLGVGYQEKVASPDEADTFNATTAPRRSLRGYDDRQLFETSLKIQWDLPVAALTSITGFSNLHQKSASSLCYDDPNDPVLPAPGGGAVCAFGPAFGKSALPGQQVDELEADQDNFKLLSEDVRLTSKSDQYIKWLVGASSMYRRALDGFNLSNILAPDNSQLLIFPSWNVRSDHWWGVYAQASADIAERLELTIAGRYDGNRYENTSYTNSDATVVVPVTGPNGQPVYTQERTASAFQPKGQLSYHFTPEVMGYVTVSRGFRAGFFESANFTLPEHTTNYELGVKNELFQHRMVFNVDVFHIDYSNQQFSEILNQPPYQFALTIPKTKIDGSEVEATVLATKTLSLGVSGGYLNARVDDGTRSPVTPRWTGTATADFVQPISPVWSFRVHADYRINSSMFLGPGDTFEIPSKGYLNGSLGVEDDHWRVAIYSRNLTDTRQPTFAPTTYSGQWIVNQNEPRSYGVRASYKF